MDLRFLRAILRITAAAMFVTLVAALGIFSASGQSVALTNLFDPVAGAVNPVTPTSSSVYSTTFPVTNVNNGASSIFVFGSADTTKPSLNFSGFNSAVDVVEFYDSNYGDRVAPSVSIYYSAASSSSLNPSNYVQVGSNNIPLVYNSTTTGAANNIGGHQLQYATVANLGIPPGTHSILFVFGPIGGSISSANSYGIAEVQAFASPCAGPTNLVATAGNAQVTLTWSAPAGGAVGYNLKRSTSAGSGYGLLTNTAATSFVDTTLINGTRYYYVVAATNAGCESFNSSEAIATPNPPVGSIAFMQQPAGTNQGAVISPAVTVAVKDAANHPLTNVLVGVSLTNSGVLIGATNQLSGAGGIATFNGLAVGTTGNGLVLRAQAGGATADSNPFNIAPVVNGALGDANTRFFGRWDFSSATQYVSSWGGAYLKVKFSGATAKIKLGNTSDYYASIDGGPWVSYLGASGTVNLTTNPLPNGVHSLSFAQGKDYAYVFNFQGLVLDVGAVTYPPDVGSNLVEFIGDSITCGYTDPQANVQDYGWVCAEALGAEHTQIAYPGIALVNGYGLNGDTTGMDVKYFKLQNLAYPASPDWDFTRYTPRVIVINLGQNDNSTSVPDALFQSDYTNFIANIRARFPYAEVFAMRPFSGVKVAPTLAAVNARIATGDAHVHYVDTTGWLTAGDLNDGVHPSVNGHIKAANLLTPILSPYLAGPTRLNIQVGGGVINVLWPTSSVSFGVEAATNLLSPAWSPVSNVIANQLGTNSIAVSADKASQFFRLKQQ